MKQTRITISPEAANYSLDYNELINPDLQINITALNPQEQNNNFINIQFKESGTSDISDAMEDAWAEAPDGGSGPGPREGYFLNIKENGDITVAEISSLRIIENEAETNSDPIPWNDGELLINFDGATLSIELNGEMLYNEIITREYSDDPDNYSEEENAYWEHQAEKMLGSVEDNAEESDSSTNIGKSDTITYIKKDDFEEDIPF